MEAEREVRHIAIKNHQHRDTGWKMLRMKAEGSEFYCYDSILVNGELERGVDVHRPLADAVSEVRKRSCSLSSAGIRTIKPNGA